MNSPIRRGSGSTATAGGGAGSSSTPRRARTSAPGTRRGRQRDRGAALARQRSSVSCRRLPRARDVAPACGRAAESPSPPADDGRSRQASSVRRSGRSHTCCSACIRSVRRTGRCSWPAAWPRTECRWPRPTSSAAGGSTRAALPPSDTAPIVDPRAAAQARPTPRASVRRRSNSARARPSRSANPWPARTSSGAAYLPARTDS